MRCPQVRIEPEDRKRFFKDPGVLTLELLFGFLSVGNVLTLYYLMSTVIPFPITVTWFQFAIGLIYARVLGECGREFPNLAYFVPLKIDWKQMTELAFPTLAFIAMIVLGNIMLSMLPAVALFPVAASFAVCSHHFTRFLGCGQVYRPIRWAALGLMLLGFLLACFDDMSVGARIVPVAIGYAIAAAAYRGCFLEKAMHTVRGLGNNLHNQQTMAGVILLPLLIAVTRERRFFTYMPDNFGRGYTWLMWGCLASAAVLPFIKNIVANRLIKIGGQPPWRVIELASMFCIFVLGFLIFDRVSGLGFVAFLLVLSGRSMNSLDALSVEAQEPRHPVYSGPGGPKGREAAAGKGPRKEPAHGAAQPFLDSDLEAAGGYSGRVHVDTVQSPAKGSSSQAGGSSNGGRDGTSGIGSASPGVSSRGASPGGADQGARRSGATGTGSREASPGGADGIGSRGRGNGGAGTNGAAGTGSGRSGAAGDNLLGGFDDDNTGAHSPLSAARSPNAPMEGDIPSGGYNKTLMDGGANSSSGALHTPKTPLGEDIPSGGYNKTDMHAGSSSPSSAGRTPGVGDIPSGGYSKTVMDGGSNI